MTTLHEIQQLTTAGNRGDLATFIAGLRALGVHWPTPPIEDILFQLATAGHISDLCGNLDFTRLAWNIETVPAAVLAAAAVPWEEGRESIDETMANLNYMIDQYRTCYGHDVWDGTWRVPPYVMDGRLIAPPVGGVCLIEGHTRMGILRGSLRRGDISPDSLHEVWVARTE